MSRLSKHHQELDERGIGKCSVPMFSGFGMDAGFCNEVAYGKPVRKIITGQHTTLYVPALACPAHGGPESRVYMDGNAWCAVLPDFANIQESPCGFGDTPEEARAELKRSVAANGNA